jgi:hypothetical protein
MSIITNDPMVQFGSTTFTPEEQKWIKEQINAYMQNIRLCDMQASVNYQISEINRKLGNI